MQGFQMKNFKIWPQMIAEAAPDIVKSMKHRLLFVENVIRFGGMSKIVKVGSLLKEAKVSRLQHLSR